MIIMIMCFVWRGDRVWDYGESSSEPRLSLRNHTDYVYGLDMCAGREGLMADCGWDAEVRVFRVF